MVGIKSPGEKKRKKPYLQVVSSSRNYKGTDVNVTVNMKHANPASLSCSIFRKAPVACVLLCFAFTMNAMRPYAGTPMLA